MDRKAKYTIPAGTTVDLRNTRTNRKVTAYVTKKDLHFAVRTTTGYEFAVWYFTHGDWSIAVNSKDVG